jgi:hypothetical protein
VRKDFGNASQAPAACAAAIIVGSCHQWGEFRVVFYLVNQAKVADFAKTSDIRCWQRKSEAGGQADLGVSTFLVFYCS